MIIILNGADFSKNNLGKVELSMPFSDRTKTMLGYYGITVDEKDSFQRKFNAFVNNLDVAGIFQKMKGLCLPFMANVEKAGSLAYAQINAIDGSNFFTTDIQGRLVVSENGFKAVEGGAVAKVSVNRFGSVTTDNMHIGAYNITNEADMYDSEGKLSPKYIFGRFTAAYGLCKIGTDSGEPSVLDSSLGWIRGDINYKNSSAYICCNVTGTKTNIFTNGQKTEKNLSPTAIMKASDANFLTYDSSTYLSTIGGNNTYCRAAYSVLTVGEALSDEQSSILTDNINNLMDALKS